MDLKNVWGKPTNYKGLDIYPIKMIDCEEFFDNVRCLMLQKNKIQDVEVLKMSYLRFLLELSSIEGHEYLAKSLEDLLKMVTKKELRIDIDERGRFYLLIGDYIVNEDGQEQFILTKRLTENDFDKVKSIILEQNLIKLEEEILDPELEKKLNEAREFMNRKNGRMADLEQQIVAYHCAFQIPYEVIANLTIYQFQKGLQRMDHIKEADAINKAKYSGFVDFKDEQLPNWLSYIQDTNDTDELIMSKSDLDKLVVEKGIVNK